MLRLAEHQRPQKKRCLAFFGSIQLDKHKFAAVRVEPSYVKFAAKFICTIEGRDS